MRAGERVTLGQGTMGQPLPVDLKFCSCRSRDLEISGKSCQDTPVNGCCSRRPQGQGTGMVSALASTAALASCPAPLSGCWNTCSKCVMDEKLCADC